MTKEEDRQYREIHQQVVDSLFMRSATVAGEAVKRGVRYRVACDAIYAAHYQGLFGAALKTLQNDGTVPMGMPVGEAWGHREVHELVVHEILRKAFGYLDTLDDRYVWSLNILKKKRKR
jgi:hypothetical protein